MILSVDFFSQHSIFSDLKFLRMLLKLTESTIFQCSEVRKLQLKNYVQL